MLNFLHNQHIFPQNISVLLFFSTSCQMACYWCMQICFFSSNLLFRRSAIHAEAPEFVEMSTEQEILVTGIKVVDLLAPYAKGGKIGMLHWVLTSILEVVVPGYCLLRKCYIKNILIWNIAFSVKKLLKHLSFQQPVCWL